MIKSGILQVHRLFKVIVLIAFPAFLVLSPADTIAASGDAAKGRQVAEREKCLNCHDKAASSKKPAVPFIRGQHQKYLVKQLRSFRDKKPVTSGGFKVSERRSSNMKHAIGTLSNSDINNVAAYLTDLPCRSFPENKADKIRKLPIKPDQVDACELCHGKMGRSPFIQYPKIAGQNVHYMIRQMKLLRQAAKNPEKNNIRFHRTMASHAINLSTESISGLARYFASHNCR